MYRNPYLHATEGSLNYARVGGEMKSNMQLIFLQFTGLLDKNGKEIYEGDILKAGGLSVVEWKHGSWIIRSLVKESGFLHDLYGYVQGLRPEIVGSIYENSDILK